MDSRTKIIIGLLLFMIVLIGGWQIWSLTVVKREKEIKQGELSPIRIQEPPICCSSWEVNCYEEPKDSIFQGCKKKVKGKTMHCLIKTDTYKKQAISVCNLDSYFRLANSASVETKSLWDKDCSMEFSLSFNEFQNNVRFIRTLYFRWFGKNNPRNECHHKYYSKYEELLADLDKAVENTRFQKLLGREECKEVKISGKGYYLCTNYRNIHSGNEYVFRLIDNGYTYDVPLSAQFSFPEIEFGLQQENVSSYLQRYPESEVEATFINGIWTLNFQKSETFPEKASVSFEEANGSYRLKTLKQEDCEDIKERSLKNQCYRDLAIQTLNPSFCARMYSSPTKDECYKVLAQKLKDQSLCEKVSSKCGCYLGVAVEIRNPSYCEYCPKDECWYIDSECHREPQAMWCYRAYARFGSKTETGTKTSLSDCEQTTNQEVKEKCYFGFADFTEDFGLCDKITNSKWKDLCYYDVASGVDFKTIAPSICEKISDSLVKDKCYKSFACDFSRPVESTCGKILNEEVKEACYQKRRECLEPRY